jgi:hypothetical protein
MVCWVIGFSSRSLGAAPPEFGDLRERRTQAVAKVGQRKFAQMAGVSRQTVSGVISGRATFISRKVAAKPGEGDRCDGSPKYHSALARYVHCTPDSSRVLDNAGRTARPVPDVCLYFINSSASAASNAK